MPPPIQRDARPNFASLFIISCTNDTTMRFPDAPMGCPSAIAPPLMFVRSFIHSLVTPCCAMSSCITPSDCAAKASFNSITSISDSLIPAFLSALAMAGTGPIPMMAGSTPPCPTPMISHRGVKLFCLTASSDAISTNDAPSLIPEALPAVTDPSFLKAGRKVDNFYREVVRFGNSSVSNT